MRNEKILAGFFFVLALCSLAGAAEGESTEVLLGDEADGSLAQPYHLMPLYAVNANGAKGEQITADMKYPLPFSTKYTCSECHSYDTISTGWHFNSVDSNTPSGKAGEPWIYYVPSLYTQIPLSYRNWEGTYDPNIIGLSKYQFTKVLGRFTPGGGAGEVDAVDFDDIGMQYISGKLEINCLACHNADYRQNMGGLTGYAVQTTRLNFRWAATASSGFASVIGNVSLVSMFYDPFMFDPDEKNGPVVKYKAEAFDEDSNVLLNIVREVPNERCYFCHSEFYQVSGEDGEKAEKWAQQVDVHIAAGLKCVDCHRNGLDHNIIRGYEGEAEISGNMMVDVATCESCHLPESYSHDAPVPNNGRLGAPIPKHRGIPTIHFEKLTCTACHSGPWPKEQTILTKLSRTHRLGIPNVNKDADALPHIIAPVFANIVTSSTSGLETESKIAPHRALWPAFWGTIKDDNVKPIKLSTVETTVTAAFKDMEIATVGGWPELTNEMISKAITALKSAVEADAGDVVYVAGGKIYSLDEAGQVVKTEGHPAAEPYLWSIGHNVRPAAQALGVRYCTDCHDNKEAMFFGNVAVDTPVVEDRGTFRRMIDFEDVKPAYAWAFSASFVFRPWLKVVALACSAVIAGVLLLYALRALLAVAKAVSGQTK